MFEQQKKVSVTSIVFAVVLLIIGVIIAFIIITSTGSILSDTETTTGSDNFVYTTSRVLSGSNGASTPSAKVYNQTWLNFQGLVGTADNISFKNPALFNYSLNDNFTIYIRMSSDYAPAGYYSHLANKLNSYEVKINSSGSLDTSITNGTKEIQCKGSGINLTDSIVHDLAFVYNGSIKVYEDGKKIRQCSVSLVGTDIFTNNAFNIGSQSNSSIRNYTGNLYDVFVFNSNINSIVLKDMNTLKENYKNYSLDLTPASNTFNTSNYYRYNDTLSYSKCGTGKLCVSYDGEKTWNNFKNYSGTLSSIWKSSNSLILSFANTGNISVSIGNDSNFTENIPIFSCRNQTGKGFAIAMSDWSYTEDKWGNIYIGEYGGDNDGCAFIHKSTDRGKTWSIVYNQSRDMPEGGTLADHIHQVKFNPYNNYIYATQGDGLPNSKLIRSVDNGTTWTILGNGSVRYQYISMVFTPNCRIFGTDSISTPYIDMTCNDTGFTTVYSLPIEDSAYFWTMKRDNNTGYILTGTQDNIGTSVGGNRTSALLMSKDDGYTWFSVHDEFMFDGGLILISNINSTGGAYIYYGTTNGVGMPLQSFYVNLNDLKENNINAYLNLKLNENSGTTAYDSSGNGNNGTISGATWQNDGVLVSLTKDVDYSVEPYTGIFTLLNPVYQYSYIMTSWVQGTIINTYGNMKNNFTSGVDNISAKIPILFLVLMVVVIMGVIALLVIAFSALMKKSSGFGFLNRGI